MSAPQPPPPPASGMSLYANLLDSKPASSASISSAPVLYGQTAAPNSTANPATKKDVNASLHFQPIIRRPQAKQAGKPKTLPSTAPAASVSATTAPNEPVKATATNRNTLADWTAATDDYWADAPQGEKRQRGGRKNKKKNKNTGQAQHQAETDWDEIYDPARPTNVDEYLRSDERIREVQEWKRVLYAHRTKRPGMSVRGSWSGTDSGSGSEDGSRGRNGADSRFAPPPDMSFAPPPPSPPRAAAPPPDESADEAYARRMALSNNIQPPPPTPSSIDTSMPPPPPLEVGVAISRAPVRYNNSQTPPPPPPQDHPPHTSSSSTHTDTEDTPMPDRPSKSTFAKRLMSKYGWTSGTGLGASSTGITTPLSVQVEKRRKRPDAEGGGFVDPAGGRGKIVGGKVAKKHNTQAKDEGNGDDDEGEFGKMSTVVVLRNMLTGIDNLREEVAGGLSQEIGEECGDKYGRVERIYFDYAEGEAHVEDTLKVNAEAQVFIKFTDAISGLRAVNALQGRVFNGNSIAARFFDEDKFERDQYR